MIAIPATAILLTNLDFWEKIRAVCKLVTTEQRTSLARSWSGDPFAFSIILSWSTVTRCRLGWVDYAEKSEHFPPFGTSHLPLDFLGYGGLSINFGRVGWSGTNRMYEVTGPLCSLLIFPS